MLTLDNARARALFLDRHALCDPARSGGGGGGGDDLAGLVTRLGFVQIDSINTVARAHHMILWSRARAYRPESLTRLLQDERRLFEHWTHDAAAIPSAFLPHWRLRFARDAARLAGRWRDWQGGAFETLLDQVLDHVRRHGPVPAGDLAAIDDRPRPKGGWWNWHPSKTALEFLWRAGLLAVSGRAGFTKLYDLAERVYPAADHGFGGLALQDGGLLPALPPPEECAPTIAWACDGALARLGFATPGEIAAFWALASPDEARAWCRNEEAQGRLVGVHILGADGAPRRALMRPETAESWAAQPDALPARIPDRLRILSPFDPALRDRARAERLFGFHYRIEVFTPEAQRRFGYYVFPVLEGARLIGRLDAKARRAEECLGVTAFWPEPGLRMTKARLTRLKAELQRLAGLAGCARVDFAPGWLHEGPPPPR